MPSAPIAAPAAGNFLLFGATGAIGGAILTEMANTRNGKIVAVARRKPEDNQTHAANVAWVFCDPLQDNFDPDLLVTHGPFDAVCWAQGMNASDDIYSVDLAKHEALYRANVLYIVKTLNLLLTHDILTPKARLCVISSIWQTIARNKKLSYCVSKSALQGLVLSAAADLAIDGHLINAVLPGALDTPMTRAALSSDQIDALANATRFARLPQLQDVVSLVAFLCSPANTGITGQFIAADLGFRDVRIF